MRNKKSSLSLSINAIVILILAITMLGLGLTFMRGLFKQATEKVEAAVSAQELTNPPTIDNVMTISPGKTTKRLKDVGKVLVAFMNTGAESYCALSVYNNSGVKMVPDGSDMVIYNDGATTSKMTIDQINTWTISILADLTDAGTTEVYTALMCCHLTDGDKAESCDTESTQFKKDFVVTYTS